MVSLLNSICGRIYFYDVRRGSSVPAGVRFWVIWCRIEHGALTGMTLGGCHADQTIAKEAIVCTYRTWHSIQVISPYARCLCFLADSPRICHDARHLDHAAPRRTPDWNESIRAGGRT